MSTRSEITQHLNGKTPIKSAEDPEKLTQYWTKDTVTGNLINLGECDAQTFDQWASQFLELVDRANWPAYWRQIVIKAALRLTPIYYIAKDED